MADALGNSAQYGHLEDDRADGRPFIFECALLLNSTFVAEILEVQSTKKEAPPAPLAVECYARAML